MVSFQDAIWFRRNSNVDSAVARLQGDYRLDSFTTASDIISHLSPEKENVSWMRRKLRALLIHQWGRNAGGIADLENLEVVLSKSTGKIKHIKLDDEILFTIVPTTGLITPTFRGGQELLRIGIDGIYKVIIDSEVSQFVSSGKSALAKFVKHADGNLRAGEEVLVLDEADNLLGTGRSVLSGKEMIAFNRGVAVMIRHSRKH